MSEQSQIVKITLEDGRTGYFLGPVFVNESDAGMRIIKVEFVEAQNLPEGSAFERLDEITKGRK